MQRPTGWAVAGAICALVTGCIDTESNDSTTEHASHCSYAPDTYTPYDDGAHPTGSVTAMPWQGAATSYPGGIEDFRAYAAGTTVECSSNKGVRSHVDVTSGCLEVTGDGHGEIVSTSSGGFRALALAYDDQTGPVKWTDQSIEYSFFYTQTSGAGVLPGFKAFARYQSEDDLYVASWRVDGVVQIQKKHCGTYSWLKVLKEYGAPSKNAWHTIRFDVVGNQLDLYLDGEHVISTTDSTFASGTAGIRTDAMTGALIDDWRVGPVVGDGGDGGDGGGPLPPERTEHQRPVILSR